VPSKKTAAADCPRVLFVDDNLDWTEVLTMHLKYYCEIQSVICANALSALQVLNVEKFDLIVSDFHMPGMDGGEFLMLASERWPRTRRILLSGHRSADMLHECEHFCDEVLDKLLAFDILCEKICKHAKTQRPR
jgi:DNA-binding NtrC family response regulator